MSAGTPYPPHRTTLVFAGALLLAALVGYVDFVTGIEVSLSVFYALPVIVAVWHIGRNAGLCMTLFAVLARFTADWANHHVYTSEWIRVWNVCVALTFLVLIVIGFSAVREKLSRSDSRISKLESTLPICSCCKKIEDENGSWSTLEDYLREHLHAKPSAKVCRDCARNFYAKNMGPGSGVR